MKNVKEFIEWLVAYVLVGVCVGGTIATTLFFINEAFLYAHFIGIMAICFVIIVIASYLASKGYEILQTRREENRKKCKEIRNQHN